MRFLASLSLFMKKKYFKLLVTFFARMRIEVPYKWVCPWKNITHYPNLSHNLQGWGFLAVLSVFHEKRLPKLLVTHCAMIRFFISKFVKWLHICQINVKFFAMMRFLTSVSLFMRQYYLNFLSHSLQGWGFSPVWVCSWDNIIWTSCHILCKDEVSHQCEFVHEIILSERLVTFYARMRLLSNKFVHEKRSPKLLVTFCARMRFLIKLSLFIAKNCPKPKLLVTFFARMKFLNSMFVHEKRLPKLLVTCVAWMRFLTSFSLLMRKMTQTFCHILCKDKFFSHVAQYISRGIEY